MGNQYCTDCANCALCFKCVNCVGLLGASGAKNIDMRGLLTRWQWVHVQIIYTMLGIVDAEGLVNGFAAPYKVNPVWLKGYLWG